jgi:starch synthase
MSDLQILFCSPEASPYAKTGGLADVVGALPGALRQLGCDVRLFLPYYRCVRDEIPSAKPLLENLEIPVGLRKATVHIREARTSSGITVYLLEKDEYFDRSYLYGSPARGDYEDNAERFITFCRSVHPLCTLLNWFPSVFHLHDWQTALISAYHRFHWIYDPHFSRSGTLFTIHNLAYQGLFPGDHFHATHLPPEAFSTSGLEFWGHCNFLKAGLVYSDFLTTVSPRYSREIQTPEFGYGLEGVLQERHDRLSGILNGIDVDTWNPETDRLIPARFSASDMSGKKVCKEALLSELGFPEQTRDRPLLGIISRLATQKGFDLLIEILEELMSLPILLVILGTGDREIEHQLKKTGEAYPDHLKIVSQFNEVMAHRIEAAADIFLMPSRYEPCGLNQMYSLRYGTIPVVHATGGLDDSVVDVSRYPHDGTGFKFEGYTPEAFLEKIRLALNWIGRKEKWEEIQRRAMAQDFSWTRSAREYMKIYREIVRAGRPGQPKVQASSPSSFDQFDDSFTPPGHPSDNGGSLDSTRKQP